MKFCQFQRMSRVKLTLNLESLYFNKTYKSIYLFGKLINNIIFDNEIIEEKSAKVKIVFKPGNPIEVIDSINKNFAHPNWIVNFSVDPTTLTKPLNKDGHRVSTFISEELIQ